MRVEGQITELMNQVQVEAALEANHMSCYVEKKLRKENMQKYMLPSAASRLDKVADTPEALKTGPFHRQGCGVYSSRLCPSDGWTARSKRCVGIHHDIFFAH